ncbi:MAG: hypothetical protein BAA01_16220 [Bacillus thermozeamaize]|uniref:Sigma-54-dependent Fis family transcriptional regulator n=1 Tax=Bacillus thermozeamaize TaxID=230954 RepID=A0A1Y3PW58_9BACI|nr:MAG: hypothetical protein BAA01_16220 [Bacillus thermozeamaize]
MRAKILMTSPYPQMTEIIHEIAKELEIPVMVIEGTMTEAAQAVKQMIEKEPSIEIVISRAGTYQEIARQNIGRPLLHCDNSDFDILEAFWRAKKIGDKVAFLTFQDERYPYQFSTLKEILGFDIFLYPYQNWEQLVSQIEQAKRDGMDVIVGGGKKAMQLIQAQGMKGVHIATSRRAIARALLRANEIVNYRIEAREKAEQLQAILNMTGEAIIVTDKLGRIIYFNPSAESVLGIRASNVIGLSPQDILSISPLNDILQSISRNIVKIYDNQYVVELKTIEIESSLMGKIFILKEVNKIQQLETQIRKEIYHKGLVAKHCFDDIIHNSEKMKQVILKAQKYAETDSTILITGESGVGKELLAQSIHNASLRKDGPFVAINCAAISESLLESELFGYAEGAFTGAKKGGKPGVFELAHGGTLFLDEIGEISTKIQAILLRVLQEKEIMRVGGDRMIPVDVRVIAATNKNLWESVQKGLFREDLFFRLNVLRLQVPPLRERKDDIPLIVNRLLRQHKVSMLTWEQLPDALKQFFLDYDWPGNIRQLENVVERLVLNLDTLTQIEDFVEEILYERSGKRADLSGDFCRDNFLPMTKNGKIVITPSSMEEMEIQILEQMLKMYNNNRSLVAEKLGISRTTLWKKLKDVSG